jgi:hypothetical protein
LTAVRHAPAEVEITKLIQAAVALALILAASPRPAAAAPAPPAAASFPRLAGMLIGDPHNYGDPAYQARIARLDLAVLGMYEGWNGEGKSPGQAVAEIKAMNPAILLANYTVMTEVGRSGPAEARKRRRLRSGAGPDGIGDWWAYDAKGRHTDWSGGAYGAWDTNLTLLTTPDGGEHWPQWLARTDYERLLKGAGFDLWYSDNNMWRPRSNADWDRDRKNDSVDDVRVRNWWRDGQRAYYDTARALAPDLPVMVNADSDLSGEAFPPGADRFKQYRRAVGAAFLEHAMGKDWSAETWGGWPLTMAWYHRIRANLLAPRIVVFDAYLDSADDYQLLRYALASTLMDDGYFSASRDYNAIAWFDEFDLAGTASTKWLGPAVDPPQTEAWQDGVYRRRFAHGMALVNPKGNGRRVVMVEPGYRRISGTQAPDVNNGRRASKVTLPDRDGILLVKD